MTSLLRTSAESEKRTLTIVGAIMVLVALITIPLLFTFDPFSRKPADLLSVVIETPYVGAGVAGGTPLMMHGVEVGQVTGVSSRIGGGVQVAADLQPGPTSGLTTNMAIDFRPANYFGVTGINIIHNDGGRPLQDGVQISVVPKGNFTLQELLYGLGDVSGVFDQKLIGVIERASQYVDGLNPLLETLITVSRWITNVQTVSTEQLLRNTTGIGAALPGLTDALVGAVDNLRRTQVGAGFDRQAELDQNRFEQTYDAQLWKTYNANLDLLESDPDKWSFGVLEKVFKGAETDIFTAVGVLTSSHIYDLFPTVEILRTVSDVVPKLISPGDLADKLRELRTRLERMYAGSGDQRALQVRIILDQLPGVATPLALAVGAAG